MYFANNNVFTLDNRIEGEYQLLSFTSTNNIYNHGCWITQAKLINEILDLIAPIDIQMRFYR